MTREEFSNLIRDQLEMLYSRAVILVGDASSANQILQEILEILQKQFHEFKTNTQFMNYAYRLLFFRCHEIVQQRNPEGNKLAIFLDGQIQLKNCIGFSDAMRVLVEKINELEVKTRNILLLYFFDKMSTAEIALFYMCSSNTIRNLIFKTQVRLVQDLVADGRESQYFTLPNRKTYSSERAQSMSSTSSMRSSALSSSAMSSSAMESNQAQNQWQYQGQYEEKASAELKSIPPKEEQLHQQLAVCFDTLRSGLDLDQINMSQLMESLSNEGDNKTLSREEKRIVKQVGWEKFRLFLKAKFLKQLFLAVIFSGLGVAFWFLASGDLRI